MQRDTEADALFTRLDQGDESARKELFPLVYKELHQVACSQMARQDPSHTLQPTALVNEAFLRLCGRSDVTERQHFVRLASKVMRQILVDHARRKSAAKRQQPGDRVELETLVDEYERRSGGLVALDAALERLEQRDPELVRLIELRFFGGRSMPEVAELLGVSERHASRWWQTARVFLQDELNRD